MYTPKYLILDEFSGYLFYFSVYETVMKTWEYSYLIQLAICICNIYTKNITSLALCHEREKIYFLKNQHMGKFPIFSSVPNFIPVTLK